MIHIVLLRPRPPAAASFPFPVFITALCTSQSARKRVLNTALSANPISLHSSVALRSSRSTIELNAPSLITSATFFDMASFFTALYTAPGALLIPSTSLYFTITLWSALNATAALSPTPFSYPPLFHPIGESAENHHRGTEYCAETPLRALLLSYPPSLVIPTCPAFPSSRLIGGKRG